MSLIRFRLGSLFPLIGAVTLGAFAGCASSTVLQSQPQGARVLINGVPVGNTPYTMTDTKIIESATPIRLEYPGYQPFDTMIIRSEEIDPAPFIGGLFIWPLLLWMFRYQATHLYVLQPAYHGDGQIRLFSIDGRCHCCEWFGVGDGGVAASRGAVKSGAAGSGEGGEPCGVPRPALAA